MKSSTLNSKAIKESTRAFGERIKVFRKEAGYSQKEIAEKMVEGRMKKFTGEVSLTGQAFVIDPSKTVGQALKEKKLNAGAEERILEAV